MRPRDFTPDVLDDPNEPRPAAPPPAEVPKPGTPRPPESSPTHPPRPDGDAHAPAGPAPKASADEA
jgi:hypothetical protein